MSDLNTCIFIGRLGRDPELKSIGNSVLCQFSMAITKKWNKDGQKQEKTSWLDFKAWGKGGELINKYVRKGHQLQVTCSAEKEEWENDGKKNSKVVFNVSEFQFIGDGERREQSNHSEKPKSSPTAGVPLSGQDQPAEEVDTIPF